MVAMKWVSWSSSMFKIPQDSGGGGTVVNVVVMRLRSQAGISLIHLERRYSKYFMIMMGRLLPLRGKETGHRSILLV
jgi:hypothetical protein